MSNRTETQTRTVSARARHRANALSESEPPRRRTDSMPETNNSRHPLLKNQRLSRNRRACFHIPRRRQYQATIMPATTWPAPNINDKIKLTGEDVPHHRFQWIAFALLYLSYLQAAPRDCQALHGLWQHGRRVTRVIP